MSNFSHSLRTLCSSEKQLAVIALSLDRSADEEARILNQDRHHRWQLQAIIIISLYIILLILGAVLVSMQGMRKQHLIHDGINEE